MLIVKKPILTLPGTLAAMFLFAALPAIDTFPQSDALGLFESHQDIGQPARPGALRYDADKQAYALEGAGGNMWADHDEFHYAWKRMRGDFILTARAEFIGKGVEQHRKIGWIVRASLDADSPHVSAAQILPWLFASRLLLVHS